MGLVLVADDDANVRSTVAEILRNEGYAIIEAADGEETLRLLAEQAVTVLVLDVRMPKLDGLSVLETLVPPSPVVLLISAYEFSSEDRERVGSKVFRYLRKPVPPVSMISAVAQAASKALAIEQSTT